MTSHVPKSPDCKTVNEPKCVSQDQTQQRIPCTTDCIFKSASDTVPIRPRRARSLVGAHLVTSLLSLRSHPSPHRHRALF